MSFLVSMSFSKTFDPVINFTKLCVLQRNFSKYFSFGTDLSKSLFCISESFSKSLLSVQT